MVGHRAAVNVVDFDDKYIVSASGDRTIKVLSSLFSKYDCLCLSAEQRQMLGFIYSTVKAFFHGAVFSARAENAREHFVLENKIITIEQSFCTDASLKRDMAAINNNNRNPLNLSCRRTMNRDWLFEMEAK